MGLPLWGSKKSKQLSEAAVRKSVECDKNGVGLTGTPGSTGILSPQSRTRQRRERLQDLLAEDERIYSNYQDYLHNDLRATASSMELYNDPNVDPHQLLEEVRNRPLRPRLLPRIANRLIDNNNNNNNHIPHVRTIQTPADDDNSSVLSGYNPAVPPFIRWPPRNLYEHPQMAPGTSNLSSGTPLPPLESRQPEQFSPYHAPSGQTAQNYTALRSTLHDDSTTAQVEANGNQSTHGDSQDRHGPWQGGERGHHYHHVYSTSPIGDTLAYINASFDHRLHATPTTIVTPTASSQQQTEAEEEYSEVQDYATHLSSLSQSIRPVHPPAMTWAAAMARPPPLGTRPWMSAHNDASFQPNSFPGSFDTSSTVPDPAERSEYSQEEATNLQPRFSISRILTSVRNNNEGGGGGEEEEGREDTNGSNASDTERQRNMY